MITDWLSGQHHQRNINKEKKNVDQHHFLVYFTDRIICIVRDFYKLDISKVKLVITQSWLNVNNDGEHQPIHTHTNSMLSGVTYLNTSEEDGIRFTDDKFNTRMSLIPIPTIKQPVEKGDIILFDSQLPHSVDGAKRKEKRVSLAFNTWAMGEIGSKDGLTFVNIENVKGVING